MNSSCSSFHLFRFSAVIFLLMCLNPAGAASSCHPDDEAGLLAFKSGITEDPTGLLSTWKKDTNCCSWEGIICFDDRVTSLTLGHIYDSGVVLSGTISPSLAKLQHLESIELANLKNITGPFPQFLSRLPLLKYVRIFNNRLSGPLPVNLGELRHLELLVMGGNQFTGPIPSSVSNMSRLNVLYLGDNLLTGTIPVEIANLKNLWNLNLEGNRLYGTIPKEFKSMKYLLQLILSRNRFSGKLSRIIPQLPPTLMDLRLDNNNLWGSIPSSISRLSNLEKLDLSKSRLSGAVPESFAKLTKLLDLNLSHNFLTDPFRVFHRNTTFFSLDLSYNQFQLGTIPRWNSPSDQAMCTLKLAKCGIKMSLDDWRPWRYQCRTFIDLSENDISGSPAKLFKEITELYEFRASGNKLKFDMKKLNIPTDLEILDLSRNLVFGEVPTIIAGLKTLNLSSNHLCGKLPPTKFPASVFANNDCLCGSPLPPCKG